MAAPVVQVPFGDKGTLPLCFSQNALYRLQKESGRPPAILGLLLVSGRGGPVELTQIVWAGLEGGRLRLATRAKPYELDEVGDLIDAAGGAEVVSEAGHPFGAAVNEAWTGAFPVTKRLQEEAEAKAKANPPAAGSTPSAAPATDPTGSSS